MFVGYIYTDHRVILIKYQHTSAWCTRNFQTRSSYKLHVMCINMSHGLKK